MLIWTLIFEKVATLQELDLHYSFDDALRAYAMLQIRADQAEKMMKNSKAK